MINMNPYDLKDSFEEYKDAVFRKKTSSAKTELEGIETLMQICYDNYIIHFHQNDLESMPPSLVGQQHKDVLLEMFNSESKIIKRFRKRFFEINKQTYNNLCPYCVIGESNTTEHILPKEEYPEFAVDVLNLIPCCSNCNSLKGEYILNDNNEKLILNFYTDTLPNDQFLFMDFTENPYLSFKYRLENVNNIIDAQLYSLIERHFKKLNLLKRYEIKAIQSFVEIKNTYLLQKFENEFEFDIFTQQQLKAWEMNNASYGINHWKQVLEKACATSSVFKQFILAQLGI